MGRWNSPFGLKNTFIENLAVQAGINIQTGFPSEFGFMGTIYVKPIQVSVALALALDGGVLVSGSINKLSVPAILGAAKTLGSPISPNAARNLADFYLENVRVYALCRFHDCTFFFNSFILICLAHVYEIFHLFLCCTILYPIP